MRPSYYETYHSLTDCQLIKLILSGDTNASFYLISVRYQKELYRVIRKNLKKFHFKFLDDTETEYWLQKFQGDMDTPTKIAGKSKFGKINDINNLKSWLCQCCNYFLFKWHKIGNYDIDFDFDTFDALNIEDYVTDSESEEQHRDVLQLKMKKYLCSYLSDRDTYIMSTWLCCMEKEFTTVHFDEKIADVLSEHGYPNMTAEYVRKIKYKAINKAKKFFKKHEIGIISGDIFLLLLEGSKNFLTEKRKAIMQHLGIEWDFISD
jgi:hypothetical protein